MNKAAFFDRDGTINVDKGYVHRIEDFEFIKGMPEFIAKIGAHIDAFYICPHHPDFTGECNCRKPKTGMIEQAIKDFDIDVKQSVLFGDKPWDIECGIKCGIKSYNINQKI